jgi:hypothetical protein
MPSKTSRLKPAMKQSSLSFVSKRPTNATGGKEKQTKSSTSTPARRPSADISEIEDIAEVARSDTDNVEITLPWEEEVEQVSEYEPSAATTSKRVSAVIEGEGKGKKGIDDDAEEIDDEGDEPPKKKRRTSGRTTKAAAAASIELDDDKGTKNKGKKKQFKGKKMLSKTVFGSRDGYENSESTNESDWATEGKIKITIRGSKRGAVAKHVNIEDLRRHFAYVREQMGNVKPSEYSASFAFFVVISVVICDLLYYSLLYAR